MKGNYQLKFENNVVGYLHHSGYDWLFYYSGWFKKQQNIKPFKSFPELESKYNSVELFPLFSDYFSGHKGVFELIKIV